MLFSIHNGASCPLGLAKSFLCKKYVEVLPHQRYGSFVVLIYFGKVLKQLKTHSGSDKFWEFNYLPCSTAFSHFDATLSLTSFEIIHLHN